MVVKVRRERPDQRRHHRVTAPLFVDYGGWRVRAADWSLGGLRVVGFPEQVPAVGAALELTLTLPFQGFDVTFQARAEVVRGDPAQGMFAVAFTHIGERERELMQHFIEELVRGAMSDVEDTIQRIDVPVTPASLAPDRPRVEAEAPVRRWPVKTVVMSALYGLAGVLVFLYAGTLAYTNLFRLEVQTAVISAPVHTIKAQAEGHVQLDRVRVGDTVRPGEMILRIYDNQLEREIEQADISVREQVAKLGYAKSRHLEELERVRSFATVEMKNVRQSRLELESIQAQLHAAEQQAKRLTILNHQGFTTASRLEEAEKKVITLQKQLERERIELASRSELAEHNLGKRLYTGDDIVGGLGEAEARERLAEHEIQIAKLRHRALVDHRQRLAIKAPHEGTVVALPLGDQAYVRRGDTIAILEDHRNRSVVAFLTQDEALKVGIGDAVTLIVPALSRRLSGRVVSVDRTEGFLREQDQRASPGYGWRGPSDRSAQVVIAFTDPGVEADHKTYRTGLPVVVVFERRSEGGLLGGLGAMMETLL